MDDNKLENLIIAFLGVVFIGVCIYALFSEDSKTDAEKQAMYVYCVRGCVSQAPQAQSRGALKEVFKSCSDLCGPKPDGVTMGLKD